jgi:hypothetical protein
MISGFEFQFVQSMKRFLLTGLIALALPGIAAASSSTFFWPAVGYNGNWPPVIDATNFVNSGNFNVLVGRALTSGDQFDPFQTSGTLNYTNIGVITAVPGFDFSYHPYPEPPPIPGVPYDSRHMAANFVNLANGVNGGLITCAGAATNDILAVINTAKLFIRATNIINSGTLSLDNSQIVTLLLLDANNNIISGFNNLTGSSMKLLGDNVDLSYGTLSFTSSSVLSNQLFNVSPVAYGIGTDTNRDWNPGIDLGPNFALSSFVTLQSGGGGIINMLLNNATAYSLTTLIGTNAATVDAVYLEDVSDPSVTKNVYLPGDSTASVEWAAPYLDPHTHQMATNYLYLTDFFTEVATNTYPISGLPINYSFTQSATPLLAGPAAPNPTVFNNAIVTNLYSYVDVQLIPTLATTNSILGGAITNLPERIEITSRRSLNLTSTKISGPDYLALTCTNDYQGNVGAAISVPFSDINLGSSSGFLSISNLLPPLIPRWSGEIQAFTGRWSDTNTINGLSVSNDNRVLMVFSKVVPTTAPTVQDLRLHATNTLTISDSLHVTRNLSIDARTLIITTNDFSTALSAAGGLNVDNPNVFWSTSMPNIRNLINNGVIGGLNAMNFARGMVDPYSDPNTATPYIVFVNHGMVTNQGTFIAANAFLNDGFFDSGLSGSFILRGGCATLTNGTIRAVSGNVSITANSLLASNVNIHAGGSLELSVADCISDGYALFNQFGHTSLTNAPTNGGVTNGNAWVADGGFNLWTKPATGDLLGTTVSAFVSGPASQQTWYSSWAGQDRGASPNGFINNAAIGRLVLDGSSNGRFSFGAAGGSGKAIYVDSIEFLGNATNADVAGNLISVSISPGMKVYYAQALAGGVSIAEKLNGRNGGRFQWVSNYAGIFSSINVHYPTDNLWHTFNKALVESQNIDSDGDLTANGNDPTPIPVGWVFNNVVPYTPCGCSIVIPSSSGSGGIGSASGSSLGGIESASGDNVLDFPVAPTVTAVGTNLFALAQGDYNGLFYETNGIVPGHAGYFSANLNGNGRLNGSLKLGNNSYPLAGKFNSSGVLLFTNLKAMNSGVRLNASLQLDLGAGGQITGEVRNANNSWIAMLLADRASSRSNQNFTFVIPGTDGGGADVPEGHGFGTLSVIGNGLVQWNASLADGTVIQPQTSARRTISSQGIYPLYFAPYGGAGLLIGWIQFTNQSDSDFEGQVIWIKPSTPNRKIFKAGFTNETGVVGSAYVQPPVTSTNDMLVLGGGNLPGLVTNVFTLNQNFKAPKKGGNQFNLQISKPTGVFNGSVIASGRTNAFNGVLLQKVGAGYGFFLGTNESGQVWFSPTP